MDRKKAGENHESYESHKSCQEKSRRELPEIPLLIRQIRGLLFATHRNRQPEASDAKNALKTLFYWNRLHPVETERPLDENGNR